jgi:hypothetical protein
MSADELTHWRALYEIEQQDRDRKRPHGADDGDDD